MAKKSMKKGGGGCGAMYGGKRHTSRRLRGGMYGVGQAITPGALEYGAAYTGPVNSAGAAVAGGAHVVPRAWKVFASSGVSIPL